MGRQESFKVFRKREKSIGKIILLKYFQEAMEYVNPYYETGLREGFLVLEKVWEFSNSNFLIRTLLGKTSVLVK